MRGKREPSPKARAELVRLDDELRNTDHYFSFPARTTTAASSETPVVLVAMGRQGAGKTALLTAVAQRYRALGADLRIWDADPLPVTRALSRLHGDTVVAPIGSLRDRIRWLEARITEQIEQRYDVVLDPGGGQLALNRLDQEVGLADMLAKREVRFVAVHVLGPDLEDLEFLDALAWTQLFTSAATLFVLNAGLAPRGWLAGTAFRGVCEHPALLAGLRRGAKVALMPALECMGEVLNRGLSFEDIARGVAADGHTVFSRVNRARVQRWWRRAMPEFFHQWRVDWLPRVGTPPEAAR